MNLEHTKPDVENALASNGVFNGEAERPRQSIEVPQPPSPRETSPEPQVATAPPAVSYHPFSTPVLALLMLGSVFGLLARLGIRALATFDGNGAFPLAWVQGIGCGIMGLAVGLREPLTL